MAAISDMPVPYAPEEAGVLEISLQSLPFEAARIDHAGVVVAANSSWAPSLPKPGESWLEWCSGLQHRSPEVSAGLLSGVRQVLTGAAPRFTLEYDDSECHWRIALSSCNGGALVLRERQGLAWDERGSQSQKMEAVGRLVGGVAHDFANLLTMITGYCDIMANRLADQHHPMRSDLEEVRKAAHRGSQLTAQLLGFTRGQSVQPKILDLNGVITDLQRMLRPIIGEYVELQTRLLPGLWNIMADAGQMEQVLMNLILNARDALPGGGRITIETANAELNNDEAAAHGMKPGQHILLTVADNGQGMDSRILAHLFQPFFTTKEKTKGTGLGLNTVRRIVRQSGGDVWARSAPGEGSVFTICLPRANEEGASRDAAAPSRQPARGTETILLVEDDDGVRQLIGHVLVRRGYNVLEASSGEEALRIFKECREQIHLVLTDIVMPQMTGRALAEHLWSERPDLKVIFMSGYTDDVLIRTGALRPGMSFLQKPLRPEALAAKLRETLDAPSQPFNPR